MEDEEAAAARAFEFMTAVVASVRHCALPWLAMQLGVMYFVQATITLRSQTASAEGKIKMGVWLALAERHR